MPVAVFITQFFSYRSDVDQVYWHWLHRVAALDTDGHCVNCVQSLHIYIAILDIGGMIRDPFLNQNIRNSLGILAPI
jgi:hypothetical protein